MHPVAHVIATVSAHALGPLVFVVGKDQIPATTVNVDGLAEMGTDHRRALQVPAGTATPPGTVPTRLIIGGGFPEYEIPRVAFVISHLNPGTRQHVLELAVRECAVVCHRLHGEQHVAL